VSRTIDSFNLWQVNLPRRPDDRRGPRRMAPAQTGRCGTDFAGSGEEGKVATMIGPFPARMQAFHVVNHAATHADDMAFPSIRRTTQPASRGGWRSASSA